MKKKPGLGIVLMLLALILSLVGIAAAALGGVSSIFSVLDKFKADESVNAYYAYIEDYVAIIENIPLVKELSGQVNSSANLSWIVLGGSLLCYVLTIILCVIGKKFGGKVINIFAIMFMIIGMLVLIVAVGLFILSLNYNFARDAVMAYLVKK